MISKDLKDIMEIAGGRYIIVENGKPCYIVMNFEEYKHAVLEKKPIKSLTEKELVDKINSDIQFWREAQQAGNAPIITEIDKLEEIEYVE